MSAASPHYGDSPPR